MSRKDEIKRADLAAPRELPEAERAAGSDELRAFQAQDELLKNLPAPALSSAAIGRILQATTQAPAKPRLWARCWVWSAAAVVLVLAIMLSGTGYAAAQSLPGETLYPIKRGYEQVRLRLMLNPAARLRYQGELGAVRRAEVQRLLMIDRQGVQVEMDGVLECDQTGSWSVSGVPLQFEGEHEWRPGMQVRIQGELEGGRLRAQGVRGIHQAGPEGEATPPAAAEDGQDPTADPEATAACETDPQGPQGPGPAAVATPQRQNKGAERGRDQ